MVSKLTVRANGGDIIDVAAFKVGDGFEVFSYIITDDGEDNFKPTTEMSEAEYETFIEEVKGMGETIREVIRE
jgi:hypothetical protein